MKQTLVTYPGLTLEVLQTELNRSPEGRHSLRLLALCKIMEGKRTQDVAEFLDYSRHAVTDWIRRVNGEGLAGLGVKAGRGRKWQLTPAQRKKLQTHLTKSPRKFGFATNLWTGKVLQEHIERQFKIRYGTTRVYELLGLLGFTLQRPTKRFLGANPEAQQAFKPVVKKNHPGSTEESQARRAGRG